MHKTIRVIYDEHRSISAVLSGLKELTKLAREATERPAFEVFRAMIYYIDAFPERMHHPKEDELLFAHLELRSAKARPLIAALRAEHVQRAASAWRPKSTATRSSTGTTCAGRSRKSCRSRKRSSTTATGRWWMPASP